MLLDAEMRSLVIYLCLTITWARAQNGRGPQHQDHNGHGWDIRLAVPGEPGNDYPTLGAIPRTSFSCAGREPGYYADLETNCQVFRVCTVGSTYGFQSFLCPNGTLFNQAVFVCDWWMNVDCQNSQQFINNNNEKFENLKLGPQLMKDIKKMLTYPMRNPYDKTAMRSNLIVMQDYKPPSGQLFPNGALLAGPERAPNNVYVPTKFINQNFGQTPNEFSFSASTPAPSYYAGPVNNNISPSQREVEFLQRQRQNGQYVQNAQSSQSGNIISNGHAGRYVQNSGLMNNDYSQAPRLNPTQITSQRQSNTADNAQFINSHNNQRGELNRQRAQYTEPRKLAQNNNVQQNNFGNALSSQQNIQKSNSNQDKQANIYSTPTNLPQFSNTVNNPELKQNIVSTIKDIPSTVATKAITYSGKVSQAAKIVKPKSRITVKTWIVKPTKSAKLIINPSPYTYPRPTQPPKEKIVINPTPYVYERPTASSQSEKTISTESEFESEEPYIYTKPTSLPKLITTTSSETTQLFISPTPISTQSTFTERLNFLSSPSPTMISRVYLTPPTFMSTSSRFYLPPPRNPTLLSRQYLPSNILQQPVYYQNAQLRSSPNTPLSTFIPFTVNTNSPSFPAPKQSRLFSDTNNLTFTDILTKEKLDITVNDIVKDTNNILKTAAPQQINQYRNEFNSVDYIENDYLPTRTTTDSGESLTSRSPVQSSTTLLKSARIIATPSPSLQPPKESFIYQPTNQLSSLPFFKESLLPNTIERTVSIKITIPERVAAYLFKNRSDKDFDKLELLNTGSSNYLVLSNNLLTKNSGLNFIPIAKLNENKKLNISNSQALVYSFLADSINVAREYGNIAQQEVLSSTQTPQFQNLNNEQLSQITNKVSQLTSAQYSSGSINNADNSGLSQTSTTIPSPQFSNSRYTLEQNQARQVQSPQYSLIPSQQTQELFSGQLQTTGSRQSNLLSNENQIYSGQLYQWPVPDVTDQIYNKPNSENLVNNIQLQNTQMLTQQSANFVNAQNNFKQSNPNIEVVRAETIPFNPAKLQLESPSEPTPFSSQENISNLFNSENGISAQLQDKIIGTISHPLEENKVVTYKKDQSYYLYTKLEDNSIDQNAQTKYMQTADSQNAKLIQGNKVPDLISFQLVPSVSYELDDEKEQQKLFEAFRIDEFGAPRDIVKPNVKNENKKQEEMSKVDISAEQLRSGKQMEQYKISAIYDGPSSYSAPQSSVGGLEARQVAQTNFNSRLEDFDGNNSGGYTQERPARQFTF